MDFAALAEHCAPGVAVSTMSGIASVESSFNPFAIGVVDARLLRQPQGLAEAVATTAMLERQGFNYSVGLIQVNKSHFGRFGVTAAALFDPCINLSVGARIFDDCLKRAGGSPRSLGDALSCYYSGNFKTGYRHGYVEKVLSASGAAVSAAGPPTIPVVTATGPKRPRPEPSVATISAPEALFVSAADGPDNDPRSAGSRQTALLF